MVNRTTLERIPPALKTPALTTWQLSSLRGTTSSQRTLPPSLSQKSNFAEENELLRVQEKISRLRRQLNDCLKKQRELLARKNKEIAGAGSWWSWWKWVVTPLSKKEIKEEKKKIEKRFSQLIRDSRSTKVSTQGEEYPNQLDRLKIIFEKQQTLRRARNRIIEELKKSRKKKIVAKIERKYTALMNPLRVEERELLQQEGELLDSIYFFFAGKLGGEKKNPFLRFKNCRIKVRELEEKRKEEIKKVEKRFRWKFSPQSRNKKKEALEKIESKYTNLIKRLEQRARALFLEVMWNQEYFSKRKEPKLVWKNETKIIV